MDDPLVKSNFFPPFTFVLTGMKSIMLAAGNIAAGRSKVAIAGGFESMSNVPFYMKRGDTPYGN